MRLVTLSVFLIVSLNVNAKKVKGYFVSHKNDTTQVTFKVPYRLSGINLLKISESLLYFSQDGERLFRLYPKDVEFVRIFNEDQEDYDILPLNGAFVQRIMEGAITCYKSQYRGVVQSVEFGRMKDNIYVYYLELQSGERRYFEGSTYAVPLSNFWVDFLATDYPEFVECLTWDKVKRKEMRRSGKECPLKGLNYEDMINLFNRTYK